MSRRVLGALVVLLSVFGCAYQPTSSSDVFTLYMASYVKVLAKRTPHDLGCPVGQQTFDDLGMYTVGVTGCENKATYKWVDGVGWVMDAGEAAR